MSATSGWESWAGVINSRAIRITPHGGASVIMRQVSRMVFERRPWRSAFKLERALPRAVRGPVDFAALRRLAARRAGVTVRLITGIVYTQTVVNVLIHSHSATVKRLGRAGADP